jgi:hypothetical protein
MAVELLLKNRETGATDLVSVATTEVFRNYWKPGCQELQLRLVPLFEDGVGDQSDIPGLIRELGLLRQRFHDTQDAKTAGHLSARVDNVVKACERVLNDPNLTIG